MAIPLVNLQDRRILVVGAAGDIGGKIVGVLAGLDAQVLAIDRDEKALNRLAQRSNGTWPVRTLAADATDEKALAQAFETIGSPLHGLVNGAAIENKPTPMDEFDTATFRKVMDINVTGVFLGMKHGIPLMREQGGSIVNISSTAGIKGAFGMSPYIASKHAVIGLTRTAAIEWGQHSIRVNAVCPGPVEGRMIDAIFGSKPGEASDTARARMAAIPSRRFSRPQEVANVIAFLLSDAAEIVNGACYSVDGGISAI